MSAAADRSARESSEGRNPGDCCSFPDEVDASSANWAAEVELRPV